MVTVSSQIQLRAIRDLPFCHVCGEPIRATEDANHDHVPARSCFDKTDRNPPLKLRTHVRCNNEHKLNDEKFGQLIAAQRHKVIDPERTELRITVIGQPGSEPQYAFFDNLDVIGAIRRWVGGFHTALYREPLPPNTWFQVTTPLPQGQIVGDVIRVEPVLQQHLKFVEALKLNRAAANLDSVVTCSSKMRYECVWAELDGGGKFCIFGLDIYGWIGLGDGKNFEPRGCVGAYILRSRDAPPQASIATCLSAPIQNKSLLDPFDT